MPDKKSEFRGENVWISPVLLAKEGGAAVLEHSPHLTTAHASTEMR
jgi:hypothetical protein